MKRSELVSAMMTRRNLLQAGGVALLTLPTAPRWSMAQTPKRGGTLRVANNGEPPHLDIHQTTTNLAQWILAPCYSGLMRIDPTNANNVVLDLAESVSTSTDGKKVTFKLRSGVPFHNGMILTADDVLYSFSRIRNPPKGIAGPRRGMFANVETIEAPDPLTVVFSLKQPQPEFLFMVGNPFNQIVPKKVAEPLDATGEGMKRQVIGTGPFHLTRAVDGQLYELSRFEKYFGEAPYLDKVQFFPIKGEIERRSALIGKRIDACFLFSGESTIDSIRKEPGFSIQHRPMPTFVNLIPNVRLKPFDDIRVRRALSLAIDRTAFIKTVGPLSGASYHSFGLLPPGSAHSLSEAEMKSFDGYDTLPGLGGSIEANRELARKLLKEAGVAPGFKISMPSRGDSAAFRDAAINIASQLKTIGLDVNVDIRDAGAFFTAESTGDFQLVVHSVALAGSTADEVLGEGYTSTSGRNYGGWKDDSLDKLFQEQSRELDPARRSELIKKFQRDFLTTYYQVHVAWGSIAAGLSNRVQGWKGLPDLYSNMQLEKVWLTS